MKALHHGDRITIVTRGGYFAQSEVALQFVSSPLCAVYARVKDYGTYWMATVRGRVVTAADWMVPSNEGVVWERGWTDGRSLLATYKLVRSAA